MNNIATRTVWGGLFVAVILISLFIGPVATAIILGVFMTLGIYEFYHLFKESKEIQPYLIIGLTGGILLYSYLALVELKYISSSSPLLFFIPLLLLPLLTFIFSASKNPLLNLGITYFPWLYVLFPFYILLCIDQSNAPQLFPYMYLLGLFILVWANDTFAFLFGIWLGKHKLFQKISPKKTWEGALGGFFCTLLFALLFALIFQGDITFWIIAGLLISPAAVLGDLIESKIKRIVKVKDAGNILPGHGGILDRFDAILFAGPFFYMLLLLYY